VSPPRLATSLPLTAGECVATTDGVRVVTARVPLAWANNLNLSQQEQGAAPAAAPGLLILSTATGTTG
jgi:hypothetical protein